MLTFKEKKNYRSNLVYVMMYIVCGLWRRKVDPWVLLVDITPPQSTDYIYHYIYQITSIYCNDDRDLVIKPYCRFLYDTVILH